jgi:hypothetical protein
MNCNDYEALICPLTNFVNDSISFEVMLPSACSFIVDVSCHCLTFSCRCSTLPGHFQNLLNNTMQQDAKI